jgi:hypothetical protein
LEINGSEFRFVESKQAQPHIAFVFSGAAGGKQQKCWTTTGRRAAEKQNERNRV